MNKWRRRIKGEPANPDTLGKMAVKIELGVNSLHPL